MNANRLTRFALLAAVALPLAAGACSATSTTTGAPSKISTEAQGTATPGKAAKGNAKTDANDTDNTKGDTNDSTKSSDEPKTNTNTKQSGTKQSGAITLVTLGDSLTSGQGEDSEKGYPGRLQDELEKAGHPGSKVVNLGRSGWTSKDLIDGSDGDRGQLAPAKEAIAEAKAAGMPVIATVLVGSNDLWRLYDPEGTTSSDEERKNLDQYRANLQQIVSTLRSEGARVVLGINDDQSKRPMMADPTMRENTLAGINADEVRMMSAQARRYADVVRDIAKDNDALIADFLDAPFFNEPRMLNEDGGHPNTAGYDAMTKIWLAALQPLL